MGGAIAIHAAADQLLPSVIGLVVVDVVEGKIFVVILFFAASFSNCLHLLLCLYPISCQEPLWRRYQRCKVSWKGDQRHLTPWRKPLNGGIHFPVSSHECLIFASLCVTGYYILKGQLSAISSDQDHPCTPFHELFTVVRRVAIQL